MVSILKYNYTNNGKYIVDFAGESTDTKPTGVYNTFTLAQGCRFLEIDTSKRYMLTDEGTWLEVTFGGGSGTGFRIEVVDELPETGEDGVLYLVPKTQGTPEDGYYEYVWIASSETFELVGSTAISICAFIDSLGNTTVSGYTVPVLTVANVTTAYNAFVADGRNVIINSLDSTKHIPVIAAFSENSNPTILVRFAKNIVLTYVISADTVTVSLFEAQEKLVSGTSIKTINGESMLGSGNIAVKTYQPVPSSWNTSDTTAQLIASIKNDATAIKGMGYLDTIGCSDLPEGLVQGEAIIEVISGSGSSKIILIRLNSADVPPYNWEYNSFAGEWRPTGGKDYYAGEGIEIDEYNEISVSGDIIAALPVGEVDMTINPASTTGATELPMTGILLHTASGNEFYKIVMPTVDTTYDPTSTNAQSGLAVAQAIAAAITTTLNTPV